MSSSDQERQGERILATIDESPESLIVSRLRASLKRNLVGGGICSIPWVLMSAYILGMGSKSWLHYGMSEVVAMAVCVIGSFLAIIAISWSALLFVHGDTFVFNRTTKHVTHNGKDICGLGEIVSISIRSHKREPQWRSKRSGESPRAPSLYLDLRDGRSILVISAGLEVNLRMMAFWLPIGVRWVRAVAVDNELTTIATRVAEYTGGGAPVNEPYRLRDHVGIRIR